VGDIGLPIPWGIVPTERLFRVVTGDDPAAGAEVSVAVPGGALWEVYSIRVQFTTDATVLSRNVRLTYDDGMTEFYRTALPADIPAGQNFPLSFADYGAWANFGNISLGVFIPLASMPLLPGYRIRTNTANLQAGDNYGAPVLFVAEYQVRGLERAVERYERAVAEAIAAPG